jgi:hypothetical protein
MSRLLLTYLAGGLALAGIVVACGGNVEVDEPSGSSTTGNGAASAGPSTGGGASGGSGAAGSGASTGASGGGSGVCTDHDDCSAGQVCLFSTGQCVESCEPLGFCEECGEGTICDGCGTSSCPGCKNCTAACVPIQPGQCDANDGCPAGSACEWFAGTCQPLCGPNGSCPGGLECLDCATGSCCGCEDCVGLCFELDG